MNVANELLRGSVWSFCYLDDDEPKPVVIVSNDGRNRSRFEWVHVVRITTRPKRALPTIVELTDRDAPLTGRAMTDELELVHKGDLEDRRGILSPLTESSTTTGTSSSDDQEGWYGDMDDVLDEVYQRMRGTGPEFDGWLSNHAPMASDALIRIGRGDQVERWVDQYVWRLQDAPRPRWPIQADEWRDVLGDPSRLGDWIAFFLQAVRTQSWQQVLVTWWPRLLPGAIASAAHGLIRTGHAVRALHEHDTPGRQDELAQGLGYWAARWQRVPDTPSPQGSAQVYEALSDLPITTVSGGIRARLIELSRLDAWPAAVTTLRPPSSSAKVPTALDAMTDAAVAGYRTWAHGDPVMLVHAATGPRAAALALPVLPQQLWMQTYEAAWRLTAALVSVYRPTTRPPDESATERASDEVDVVDQAVATSDEHAIKFAEVALESHRRGNPDAIPAAARAARLIGT